MLRVKPGAKSNDPREFPRANFSRQPLRTFHCLYHVCQQDSRTTFFMCQRKQRVKCHLFLQYSEAICQAWGNYWRQCINFRFGFRLKFKLPMNVFFAVYFGFFFYNFYEIQTHSINHLLKGKVPKKRKLSTFCG